MSGLTEQQLASLHQLKNDQTEYLGYLEMVNSNGDPRIPILSFAEWLADGKPEQRVVNLEDDAAKDQTEPL